MAVNFLTIQAMTSADLPPHRHAALSGNVPASYVRLLFDYLAGQGVDAGALPGFAGIVAGGAGEVPARRWRALLEAAASHLDDPALGLRLGAGITPAHLGPLGYVLLASSTVPAALERYLRYQRLVHDVSPVRHYLVGGQLVLEWGPASGAIGLLANQCGLAALVQFARLMTGVDVRPLAVHFVEPQPADLGPYAALFGCPVRFGQDATRVCLPASLLELPLRHPDPALAAMLEQQVQAHHAALPDSSPFERALRLAIAAQLLQGEPGLDRVAARLHVSGRTLRRRLEQHGGSFRAALDDTRKRLAQDYLDDAGLSLPEVALLLGYSEQSAFNRAFLRWTGQTPRRWRTGLRPAASPGVSPLHAG